MPRMWDKPCSRCQCGYQSKKQRFEYPGKQGISSLWRQSSMSGCQSNDFDETGMSRRKPRREWQSSSVIASFNSTFLLRLPISPIGRKILNLMPIMAKPILIRYNMKLDIWQIQVTEYLALFKSVELCY